MSTSSSPRAVVPDSTSSTLPLGTALSQYLSANSGGQDDDGGSGSYLHTFFATGLILAAVLLTIIVCGIAFRLRRQRHLAALLAADPSYVRPGWVGNSYLAFPRIWEREEVRAPPPPIHELLVSGEAEKEAWVDIMPLAVIDSQATPSSTTLAPSAAAPYVPRDTSHFERYVFPTPSPAPSAGATAQALTSSSEGSLNSVHVVVMIAMPDATRASIKPESEDAPPPYLEFGLAHMPARAALSGPPKQPTIG